MAHVSIFRTTTGIDRRLLAGAAMFGVGWGLSGYCPGPAVTALPLLNTSTWIFVAAMLLGMWLGRSLQADVPPRMASAEVDKGEADVEERTAAMSTSPLRVAVVGGGIGGVAAAVALLRRGLDVGSTSRRRR